MKYIIVISFLVFCISSQAQNCNPETLIQQKGIWKVGLKSSQGGTAAELAKEKKIIAAIHKMITSKYSPMGLEVIYHGAYNPLYPHEPANGFAYSLIPLNFYCDGNKMKTVHETPTYFAISANIFATEIFETPDIKAASSGTGYHYISDMPIAKDGFWYFNEKDKNLGFDMTGKEATWLITYDGQLPFAYVTKKEFLETRKVILANTMKDSESGHQDVLKRIEIEKGFKEKEFKNDPEKLKKYLRMDYESVKSRYEKLIADNTKLHKPAFEKIETLLKMSEKELKEPAIVKMDPNDHLSYLFTDDDDPFGQVLIKPNPGYFKKISRGSPQFFWIYIRGNHKDPIVAKFLTEIIKATDVALLRNMLGK